MAEGNVLSKGFTRYNLRSSQGVSRGLDHMIEGGLGIGECKGV
jgi:hypothetical protein